MIVFSLFLIAVVLRNSRYKISVLYIGTFVAAAYLLLPINLNSIASNNVAAKSSNFKMQYFVEPAPNSKLELKYQSVYEGNFKYNSPVGATYMYLTGNGALPCVNREQLQFYKTYFDVAPQLRTADLKDGFYAKEITKCKTMN